MSQFYDRAIGLKKRGYTVVPIKQGKKGPVIEGWQDLDVDEKTLQRMSLNGYSDGNLGINARNAPAIDIDVLDEDMAQLLEAFLLDRFGDTCVRIGRFPKRLLMFRTSRPFRKLYANLQDELGGDHKIEILGDGQQYLAYGVHPDTGSEYYYTSLEEPLVYDLDELPLMEYSDAVEALEAMLDVVRSAGWIVLKTSLGGEVSDVDDFALETLKPVMKITEESIIETLSWIPNEDEDYDVYLDVGMALHHQFGGEARGLELWHEWAEQSGKYVPEDVNKRYASMGHGPATKTFRSLVHLAKENKEKAQDAQYTLALNKIDQCNDKKRITGELARDLMKCVNNELQFDEATHIVQRKLKELSDGVNYTKETVKNILRKARPKEDRRVDLPKWCENWHYVASEGCFYNTHTGMEYTATAFDSVYGEHLVTDEMRRNGDAFGGKPSLVALNLHRIPKVYAKMYLPGHEELMKVNGMDVVNTYNRWNEPKEKAPSTSEERAAVRRAQKHFEVLFPDERERRTFIDYLAYTLQFPTEKINWAVVIQGVDGAGKSWFTSLLSAVLGGSNVDSISASQLKEQYTKWAEGRRVIVFEEIRLHGDNRFEILDKIKPYVTNPTVPVRRMRADSYSIMNVTNYIMFTNFPDALPINRNDRRYFVLKTSFQTKADLRVFKQTHPGYFGDLFDLLTLHWPVIRHWLLTHKISDDFDAKGEAPDTEAKEEMIEDAESEDDMSVLQGMIEDPDQPGISDEVLLGSALRADTSPLSLLNKRAIGSLLYRAGFAKLGQFRLGGEKDPKDTVYTRRGDLYRGKDKLTVIRGYLGPDLLD